MLETAAYAVLGPRVVIASEEMAGESGTEGDILEKSLRSFGRSLKSSSMDRHSVSVSDPERRCSRRIHFTHENNTVHVMNSGNDDCFHIGKHKERLASSFC